MGSDTFNLASLLPLSAWFERVPLPVVTGALVVLAFSAYLAFRSSWVGNVYEIGGGSLLCSWRFFTYRHDFLFRNFSKSGANILRFRLFKHVATVVRGDKAKKAFFTNPNFGIKEGYVLLHPAIPTPPRAQSQGGPAQAHVQEAEVFAKMTIALFNRDRFGDAIPILLDDVHKCLQGWGKSGRVQPFTDVHNLLFHMTIRLTSCNDLANDHKAVMELRGHFDEVEKAVTPVGYCFPFLRRNEQKIREHSIKSIYLLFRRFVQKRRAATTSSSDAIDWLMSQGLDDDKITGCVMGLTFAAAANTGVQTSWLTLYLGAYPQWREKIIAEYKAMLAKHSSLPASAPMHQRLATIPLQVWETELPTMDIVIRESMRLNVVWTALRRNVDRDLAVDGADVKQGEFLVYNLADTHMDPEIYSNPTSFDPSRFGPGRQEDQKAPLSYLAWGAGRHPCTGTKVAKLEMKVVLAPLLLCYDYKLVDANGNPVHKVPVINYNDHQQSRPHPHEAPLLQYTRKD